MECRFQGIIRVVGIGLGVLTPGELELMQSFCFDETPTLALKRYVDDLRPAILIRQNGTGQ